ncbi:MAG TPA: 4-(cytidine 5'-diphospho)-2-C-methyl-D-erythritol kinase [Gammaproteobacteria bacterium]|nr:4-(cytidine 5'-diphospho)-2-C-methyl-D-erythritol kinase [Gammaproteobacteria bacterium]
MDIWPAPAKLNLFLHITGRRSDGYHELQTIFQILDYGDELAFEVTETPTIARVTDIPGVPAEHDLIVRAAALLQAETGVGQGVRFYIDKRLPMGGGLGGGSSDAATTLVALNHLWGCDLSVDQLARLGCALGADVPVFVRGHTAWGEGIGELLAPVELKPAWYVVIRPDAEIATPALFSSPELTRDCVKITIRDFLASGGENVFEELVREQYPEVDKAMKWLDNFSTSRLTGTGSCIFAEVAGRDQADRILAQLPPELTGFAARGVNRSPLLNRLSG